MCEVRLRNGEDSFNLINRFIKRVKKEGVLQEYFQRKHHKPRSAKRREKFLKRRTAIRRQTEKHQKMLKALDD